MKPDRIRLLRRACKAHPTKSHRIKWLAAVAFLRSRHLWLIEKRQPRSAA